MQQNPTELCGLDLIIYADTAAFLGLLALTRPNAHLVNELLFLPTPPPSRHNHPHSAFHRDYSQHIQTMQEYLSETREARVPALEADWFALLHDGKARPSPRASRFLNLDPAQQSMMLGELEAAYGSFLPEHTVNPPSPLAAMPDFLGIELHFAGLLLQCAANQEHYTLSDVREFYTRHLQPWIPAFCAQAEQKAATPLYKAYFRIIDSFLRLLPVLSTPV